MYPDPLTRLLIFPDGSALRRLRLSPSILLVAGLSFVSGISRRNLEGLRMMDRDGKEEIIGNIQGKSNHHNLTIKGSLVV